MPRADLDALEQAARAATPGPWHVEEWGPDIALDAVYAGDRRITVDFEMTALFTPENAAYIAAADPQTILALIAVVRAVTEEVATMEKRGYVTWTNLMRLRVALAALGDSDAKD